MKRVRKDPSNTPALMRYRFRAECVPDIGRLLSDRDFQFLYLEIECSLGDSVCSFSSSLSLDEVRNIMWRVVDGHVMAQSVAVAENYTGERDFDLEAPGLK